MNWLADRLMRTGSTRALGLVRVLLALVVWSRWAGDVSPYIEASPQRVVLAVAFFASSTSMAVGWYSRASTAATGVVVCTMVLWFGRVQGVEDWTHHHPTVLAILVLLLALTPCGRSFSLDRYLAVGRTRAAGEPPPDEVGDLWAADLLCLQVCTLYLWSAVDKTTWAYVSGARLEQLLMQYYVGSDWPELPLLQAVLAMVAVAVLLLEYVLVVGLWVPRLRRWLIPLGLAMHGLFYVLIPVSTFTVTMWTVYLLFLDPDVVHRSVDRLVATGPGRP